MASYQADVRVLPRHGINNPEGTTILSHLEAAIGQHSVSRITTGKLIRLELTADDIAAATAQVQLACDELLVNAVIGRYELDIREVDAF